MIPEDLENKELLFANKVIGKNPKIMVKGQVMDVLKNLKLEEKFDLSNPPKINKYSSLAAWANGTRDITMPADAENIYLQTIRNDGNLYQYVGYVRHTIPDEEHVNMKESFFIIDGKCILTIDQTEYHFGAGDYFELPLHGTHNVRVTSTQPLKAVLQRVMI